MDHFHLPLSIEPSLTFIIYKTFYGLFESNNHDKWLAFGSDTFFKVSASYKLAMG
jgi:hypothetical protein